jgi:S-adenosylmethionine hydrolase
MDPVRPIFLFTDFGWSGPYVGQMTGALIALSPQSPVISLMHDAPAMRPDLAAHLLAACCRYLPGGSVVVAVVDPGVGGQRDALIVDTRDASFVGPDNGLLARLPGITGVRRIDWRPSAMSSSFHGRDLFAPVAARVAAHRTVAATPIAPAGMVGNDWPDETREIVFVDAYGNLMTGLIAKKINKNRKLLASGRALAYAETFCHVPRGELFWYCNSQGLVEIAGNGVSAAGALSLAPGDEILLD